jgi:Coenzyme PQQ synthesis protein D (PqqD)
VLRPEVRLRLRADEVAAKVMDGEAVLINLTSGVYYSMDGTGTAVWELITARCTLREIAEALVARYDVAGPRAQADIQRLATELIEEQLVEVDDGPVTGQTGVGGTPTGSREPYRVPELQVYRDMADLLALDPPLPDLPTTPWHEAEGLRRG